MSDGEIKELSAEEELKLKNSFKRHSPETIEAILRFRKGHDTSAVIVAVHGIMERYVKLAPGQLLEHCSDDMRLGEDFELDSLTMLEIVMSIEEALDFRIPDTDVRGIRTLGDVRRYVDDRVHNRPISITPIKTYDRDQLCLLLPHQPPFLFLDAAEIQGDVVRASYTFTGEEFFFQGHYPNNPIVPASIVSEAMGQACVLWILEQVPARLPDYPRAGQVLFVGAEETRFTLMAKPGDKIRMEQKLVKLREPLAIFDGTARIQKQQCARVEGLTLAFGEFTPMAGTTSDPASAPEK